MEKIDKELINLVGSLTTDRARCLAVVGSIKSIINTVIKEEEAKSDERINRIIKTVNAALKASN